MHRESYQSCPRFAESGEQKHPHFPDPINNFSVFSTLSYQYFYWQLCSRNSRRNPYLIPQKLDFSRLELRLDASGGLFFAEGTQQPIHKRVYGVVFMRKSGCQALYPFRGRLSGAAYALRVAASRLTTSRLPPCVLIDSQIYFLNVPVGRPDPGYAPLPIHSLSPFLGRGHVL